MGQIGDMSDYDGTSGTAARVVGDASASVHGAIDKASASAKPAVDRLASGAHQAVDRIATAASDTAETLGAKAGQLKDAQVRVTEKYRGYVRGHPVTSLGIALAAGFVLSRFWGSRQAMSRGPME